MKKGRCKVRMCLIGVVLLALIIGMIYYCSIYEERYQQEEGVLVRGKKGVGYVC